MEKQCRYLAFGLKKESITDKGELFMAPASELPFDFWAGTSVKSDVLQPLENRHFALDTGEEYNVWLADLSSLCKSPPELTHFKMTSPAVFPFASRTGNI